jgi:tetratricopeptide (TPR) repeat protein
VGSVPTTYLRCVAFARGTTIAMHARMLRYVALVFTLSLAVAVTPQLATAQCLPSVGLPNVGLGGDVGLRIPQPSAADLALAADLRARAEVAFRAGDLRAALPNLERAFDLTGNVDLAGMLGLSLHAEGRLGLAWLMMNRFLLEASANLRAELDARIRAAMGDIQGRLGQLSINGDFGSRGQVWLDGDLIANLPLRGALHLDPGSVRLEIRADGRVAGWFDANISIGGAAQITANLPRPGGSLNVNLDPNIGLRLPNPSAADLRLAANLRAQAEAAFNAGNLQAALPNLERAFDLTGDVSLAGMLGLALQAAGRLGLAWLMMNRFMIEADAGLRGGLEARIRTAMGSIEANLGGLRIDGDFGARGQVWWNGDLVANLPLDGAIYFDPGSVNLEIRGDARIATTLSANIAIGAIGSLSADLAVAVGAPSLAGSLPGVGVPSVPAIGFDPWPVILGLGAVAIVLGVAIGVPASILVGDLNAALNARIDAGEINCETDPGNPLCSRTDIEIGNVFEWIGWLGASVLGAAALTIGIVALVLGNTAASVPDVDLDCPEADARREQLRFMCAPAFSDTFGGGACQLQF